MIEQFCFYHPLHRDQQFESMCSYFGHWAFCLWDHCVLKTHLDNYQLNYVNWGFRRALLPNSYRSMTIYQLHLQIRFTLQSSCHGMNMKCHKFLLKSFLPHCLPFVVFDGSIFYRFSAYADSWKKRFQLFVSLVFYCSSLTACDQPSISPTASSDPPYQSLHYFLFSS